MRLLELINGLRPGNHIAISTLWFIAASVLATFELSTAVNEDGKIIEPSREYHAGVVR